MNRSRQFDSAFDNFMDEAELVKQFFKCNKLPLSTPYWIEKVEQNAITVWYSVDKQLYTIKLEV